MAKTDDTDRMLDEVVEGKKPEEVLGVSPLLANLFLHYAFDMWMSRTYAGVPLERYADDGVPRRHGREVQSSKCHAA